MYPAVSEMFKLAAVALVAAKAANAMVEIMIRL